MALSLEKKLKPPVAVGDVIPDEVFMYTKEGNLVIKSVHSLTAGRNVILFAVGGMLHRKSQLVYVPEIVDRAEELKSKGLDEIFCIAVSDPFQLRAREQTFPGSKHVTFLADSRASYARKLGVELDFISIGLGTWTRRFALLVKNLKVEVAKIEYGGSLSLSNGKCMFSGGNFVVSIDEFAGNETLERRRDAQKGLLTPRSRAHQGDMLLPPKKPHLGRAGDKSTPNLSPSNDPDPVFGVSCFF